jgi:hypothetical protein
MGKEGALILTIAMVRRRRKLGQLCPSPSNFSHLHHPSNLSHRYISSKPGLPDLFPSNLSSSRHRNSSSKLELPRPVPSNLCHHHQHCTHIIQECSRHQGHTHTTHRIFRTRHTPFPSTAICTRAQWGHTRGVFRQCQYQGHLHLKLCTRDLSIPCQGLSPLHRLDRRALLHPHHHRCHLLPLLWPQHLLLL